MMRVVLFLPLVLAACAGKTGTCEELRDRTLAIQERAAEQAFAEEHDPAKRAELERETAGELLKFKASFVGACVAADYATYECLARGPKEWGRPSPACEAPLEAVWKIVYAAPTTSSRK